MMGYRNLCALSYITVLDEAQGVASFSKGSLMAKVNMHSAYRVVPIHPDDRWLLGNKLFVNTAFPLVISRP